VGIISFDGNKFEVDKLLAYSQINDHQKYGWVVPEIASRLHFEKIIAVLENITWEKIEKVDFVSVTTHPWLPGSLVVWKAVAKMISSFFNKPLIEANHIYWHIFSLFLERNIKDIKFPMVVLTASWWHNDLYLIKKLKDWKIKRLKIKEQKISFDFEIEKIWYTLDDAAGECFDKVARMLGWPYPWWIWISQKAQLFKKDNAKLKAIQKNWIRLIFKRIFLSKDKFEFSFSGMKSQVSFLLKQLEKKWIKLNSNIINKIAYEFQEAVIEVLAKKLIKAWKKYKAKTISIAWWVSANERLWEFLNQEIKKLKDWKIKRLKINNKKIKSFESVKSFEKKELFNLQLLRPSNKIYSTDNAAMIWVYWIINKMKNE
jgi:N6-L-threonylcarbamoyladenine synthase